MCKKKVTQHYIIDDREIKTIDIFLKHYNEFRNNIYKIINHPLTEPEKIELYKIYMHHVR